MTVKELIESLDRLPPDLEVRLFANLSDFAVQDVMVEEGDGVLVLIVADEDAA